MTSGENLFYAVGYAPCNGRDKWDGCTTKDLLRPRRRVHADLVPGVPGRRPVRADHVRARPQRQRGRRSSAATRRNGNYTVGIGADVFQKYRIDLKYIDYFGKYKDNGTAVTTQNGFTTLLEDRGFVSLTFKTTF